MSAGTAKQCARAAPARAGVSLDDPPCVARLYRGAQSSEYARAACGPAAFVAADSDQRINELERMRAESAERLNAEWAKVEAAVKVSILPVLCSFRCSGSRMSCR